MVASRKRVENTELTSSLTEGLFRSFKLGGTSPPPSIVSESPCTVKRRRSLDIIPAWMDYAGELLAGAGVQGLLGVIRGKIISRTKMKFRCYRRSSNTSRQQWLVDIGRRSAAEGRCYGFMALRFQLKRADLPSSWVPSYPSSFSPRRWIGRLPHSWRSELRNGVSRSCLSMIGERKPAGRLLLRYCPLSSLWAP